MALPAVEVRREEVLGFRLSGHHLHERLPAEDMLAAATLGLRTSAPGSAIASLHARAEGVGPSTVEDRLRSASFVEVTSVRISPLIVPVEDVAVFTTGAMPVEEQSLRAILGAIAGSLDAYGGPEEVVGLAVDAAREVLGGKRLSRGELSAGMRELLPPELSPFCRGCDSHHPSESLFRLVGVAGAYCRVPGANRSGDYVALQEWIGGPLPDVDPAEAREELVLRYLRGHGPSTPRDLASWLEVSRGEAERCLDRLRPELSEITYRGRRTWLASADLPELQGAEPLGGVRLLPAYDPLLAPVDRTTLLASENERKIVFRILGNPGAVLCDGEIVAAWRGKKKGARLEIEVQPLAAWKRRCIGLLEAEAQGLALVRGCSSAAVSIAG
jgi:hypothetical protein